MPCKGKKDIETVDSVSTQQLLENKAGQNKPSVIKSVENETIVKEKDVETSRSSNKKGESKGLKMFKSLRRKKALKVESNILPHEQEASLYNIEVHNNIPENGTSCQLPLTTTAKVQAPENERRASVSNQVGTRRKVLPSLPKTNKSNDEETDQNNSQENARPVANGKTPARKKNKKRQDTEEDIHQAYKNQIASLGAADSEPEQLAFKTQSSLPTVQDENDLLANAEEERKRNKQRTRAKKMRENKHSSPVQPVDHQMSPNFQQGQGQGIDRALQTSDNTSSDDSSDFHEKKSKKKRKKEVKGENNEAYDTEDNSTDPNLPENQLGITNDNAISHKDSRDSEGCAHKPIHVSHLASLPDQNELTMWNPYRAYDDTQSIMSDSENQLKQQSQQATDKVTSLLGDASSSYYATGPAEPIIIRTKDFDLTMPFHDDSIHPKRVSQHSAQRPISQAPFGSFAAQKSAHDVVSDRTPPEYPYDDLQRNSLMEPSDSTQPSANSKFAHHRVAPYKLNDNYDVIDVVTSSLQPGSSPKPLIDSLRQELQSFAGKRLTEQNTVKNSSENTLPKKSS